MIYSATVVIVSYNQARFVLRAVADVLAQSIPCEVIVADDGSTDHTLRLLDRFGDRVRVLDLPHTGGPSAARNAGIDAASAPFVSVLDADDRIHPDKIERQILEMERTGRDWCLCDALIEGWEEEDGSPAIAHGRSGRIDYELAEYNFIPTAVPLLRTELARAVRFREDAPDDWQRVPEDWLYWRAIARRAEAATVHEVLATYSWVQHGRSGRVGIDGKHLRPRRP
jgi:glycosyltransferase involved in cell wall biosynthesis